MKRTLALITRGLSVFVITVLMFVASAGILLLVQGSGDGHVADCPFMTHGESICPFGPVEHTGFFELLFSALPPLMVVLFILAVVRRFQNRAETGRHPPGYESTLRRLRFAEVATASHFEQHLFSQGILHPRIW